MGNYLKGLLERKQLILAAVIIAVIIISGLVTGLTFHYADKPEKYITVAKVATATPIYYLEEGSAFLHRRFQ